MKILKKVNLKPGLEPEEIIFFVDIVQNILHEKFNRKLDNMDEIEKLSLEYEKMAEKWINIILYGILEKV